MKRKLCLLFSLFSLCGILFAKPTTTPPVWFGPGNTLYTVFPRNDFMAFRGEGNTEEAARADGVSKIAQSISATIKDRRETETRTLESVSSSGDVSVSENTTTSNATSIESEVQLVGLEQSEVYFDKKAKRYYCVSYIDIANFMRRVKPQIEDAKSSFYSSYNKALAENDKILSCAYYKSAASSGAVFLEKLSFAYGVNPDVASEYKEDREKILEIPSVIQQKMQESTLHLVLTGDYGNIISTAITESFNDLGLVVDRNKGEYQLQVTVSDNKMVEKNNDYEIIAIFPSVLVNLINSSGRTVYSYEKKLGKTVSMNGLEYAQKRAYPKLGEEIKAELTTDFRKKVGF